MTARLEKLVMTSVSMTTKSRIVEFPTEGKRGRGYLASPENPRGKVLVLHAWWGLNDFFKTIADKLASQRFVALAPDLYDGPIAESVEEAKVLHSKADNKRIEKIVLGAAEYLYSIPSAPGRKMGVVGFSMGAALSLELSILKPESVGAVVVFYGTYPMDFSKAQASYLGHFAPDDEWEPLSEVRALDGKLREAGREASFHFYPGTKHWFVEENRPVEYNREAADLAWKRTLAFLDRKLG
jgi:carboxymethylenebutenolidase